LYPDLTPADFCLFPGLKSALKGRRFCDATDIITAMEKLKMLSQDGLQECSKHLYSRWQKRVVVQGDSSEENVA
jgi:hypothetical protein